MCDEKGVHKVFPAVGQVFSLEFGDQSPISPFDMLRDVKLGPGTWRFVKVRNRPKQSGLFMLTKTAQFYKTVREVWADLAVASGDGQILDDCRWLIPLRALLGDRRQDGLPVDNTRIGIPATSWISPLGYFNFTCVTGLGELRFYPANHIPLGQWLWLVEVRDTTA